jgi:hypothetical protein
MNSEKLIKRLSILQGGCIHASEDTENWHMHDALVANARTIGSAIAFLKQLRRENDELRQRLVKQACYFEHIEAKQQPRTPGQQGWPLLEDEGEGL